MAKRTKAVMVTGGMDSTALLHMLSQDDRDITLITVDYGQTALQKQIDNIEFHANELGIKNKLVVLTMPIYDWQKKPGLFTEGYTPTEESPLEDWDKLRYENFFVEGRNMLMVSYAMAYCSAHKIDELYAGYLYGDEEWTKRRTIKLLTGDNSPQFVDGMNIMSQMGFSHQVRLKAPFYDMSFNKKDVYEFIGLQFGIDYSKTYSCYFTPEPCGVCDNCLLRKEIGIDDASNDKEVPNDAH